MDELLKKQASAFEKLEAMASLDNLSDEQAAEYESLEKEYDSLNAAIERKERQAARSKPEPQRQTKPAAPKADSIDFEDPKPAGPKKYAKQDDFWMDVIRAGQGFGTAVNLQPYAAVGSDEQRVGSNPLGGYLVPEEFRADLLKVMPESNPLMNRVRHVPMGSPRVSWPVRVDKDHSSSVSGGASFAWTAETGTIASSTVSTKCLSLDAFTLSGLSYVTEDLIQDSAISIPGMISEAFSQELGATIFEAMLNGTGVGQLEGIMNSDALVTVAKEGSQSADTINFQNITKMRARCYGYGNAVWLANHDCLPQLMDLQGGDSANIWCPSAREGEPDRLLGKPIYFSERLATIGDLGDILLVDASQYLYGTYQPLRSAESMHVRFVNNEHSIRFTTRVAGKSSWESALTPKRGSTLSPFVTLAARA